MDGDAESVARFRAAAAGPGLVPWRHDLAGPAEDWFHRLAAPPPPQQRSLSLTGARILVRDPGRLWLGFWAADWTPWPAIVRLRQDWPALRITVRPIYDDP